MEDLMYLYTSTVEYMNRTEKRIDKLEKAVKRNRRMTGALVFVCIGLGIDIYQLVKNAKKTEKAGKTEDKGE